jgi:preprotein translocase subunit SecA
MPLESNLLTKSLEDAQKKVELYNYDLRKNVFQYDEILNTQRKSLFQGRRELLVENKLQDLFLRYHEFSLDEKFSQTKEKNENINFFVEKLLDSYSKKNNSITGKELYPEAWITNDLNFSISNTYQMGFLKNTKIREILAIFDFYWTEHLERMSYIRETISWRSYGQQNPLLEYNNEAFSSFKIMFEEIRSSMLYCFINKKINI